MHIHDTKTFIYSNTYSIFNENPEQEHNEFPIFA